MLQEPAIDPNAKKRRWRWTWNNYTEADVKALMQPWELHNSIDYLVFGYELAPTTGTPHLQGYVEFKGTTNYSMACTRLDPTRGKGKGKEPHKVRCLPADRNRAINISYVTKPETKDPSMVTPDGAPVIFEWQKTGAERTKGAGASDKQEAWNAKLLSLKENPGLASFAAENPEEAFKYASNVKTLSQALQLQETLTTVSERIPKNMRMRVWQRAVIKMLEGRADDRSILWIYDEKGCAGKSLLSKWMAIHMGACCLTNGRSGDIGLAYTGQRIAIFDLTRSMDDTINYSVMEALKNGQWFSPKYTSECRIAECPWILIFSNNLPRLQAMSQDRWYVFNLAQNPQVMNMEEGEGLVDYNPPSAKALILGDPILKSMLMEHSG